MKNEKIVLVSPPLIWEDKLRLSFQPPLNLLYLFSYLKAHNFAVEFLDVVSLRLSLEETVDRVLAAAPVFVGIPLYYASLDTAFGLVSRLKARSPALRCVAGGPCMTMEPERMMREGAFDFGILGEGEETLAELLSGWGSGVPFETIAGLAFRKGDKVIVNPRRPPIAGLDTLPYLDFSALNNEFYFKSQEAAGAPRMLFLTSSRGCSFRCTYCCTPALWPGKTRRYSPGRLIDEIMFHLERFPGTDIGFCDDSFFSDRGWLMEFIRLIKPLRIKYKCIGRADHLTAPVIRLLVESGLNYIAFGVETGNSRRQSLLKKNLDLAVLIGNMKEFSKYDVKTNCFFMLGFPDETPEEMAETVNLASALKRQGMTFFSIFPVIAYPGTELAGQFPARPFKSGLEAHLQAIIKEDLAIGRQSAATLDGPFNSRMTYRQLVDLITFAYRKVEQAEMVGAEDIERILHK